MVLLVPLQRRDTQVPTIQLHRERDVRDRERRPAGQEARLAVAVAVAIAVAVAVAVAVPFPAVDADQDSRLDTSEEASVHGMGLGHAVQVAFPHGSAGDLIDQMVVGRPEAVTVAIAREHPVHPHRLGSLRCRSTAPNQPVAVLAGDVTHAATKTKWFFFVG